MKRSLAFAFCLAVAANVESVSAQPPQPLDILGIQLGMAASQATQILNSHAAALRAHNVRMLVQPAIISFDVLPKPITWGMRAVAIGNGPVPTEGIFVVFTMPPNPQVVAEVHRKLEYRENMPAKDALLDSLRKKYGPESVRQKDPTDVTHSWLFKDGRQQFVSSQFSADSLYLSVCASSIESPPNQYGESFDNTDHLNNVLIRGFSADVQSKCGSRVFAMTNFDVGNPALVDSFSVSIADLAMEDAALEKTRTLLQNAANAKRQEQIKKAKQTNPSL